MEKLKYPFEAGKAGIPLEKIFNDHKEGRGEGVVEGGSGSTIKYSLGSQFLCISDLAYPDRFMAAGIMGETIAFNFKTTISNLDLMKINYPWAKHPDMFAGKFIETAFWYFEGLNNKINACKDRWIPNSINNDINIEQLAVSGNHVEAAKSTWSGKIYGNYGFTKIGDEDIKHIPCKNGGYVVVANFHRNAR